MNEFKSFTAAKCLHNCHLVLFKNSRHPIIIVNSKQLHLDKGVYHHSYVFMGKSQNRVQIGGNCSTDDLGKNICDGYKLSGRKRSSRCYDRLRVTLQL